VRTLTSNRRANLREALGWQRVWSTEEGEQRAQARVWIPEIRRKGEGVASRELYDHRYSISHASTAVSARLLDLLQLSKSGDSEAEADARRGEFLVSIARQLLCGEVN